MTTVTIQILEGLERGTVHRDLNLPITIGREDDNVIRLNDERVSRFHAKIQHDGNQLILTDLESTNGTRVNGHPVQMRILRVGDNVVIGRCLLVIGSPEELASLVPSPSAIERYTEMGVDRTSATIGDLPVDDGLESEELGELFPQGPPTVPGGLQPVHRAQVSDIVAYVHEQLGHVARCGREDQDGETVSLDRGAWQRLLRLQMEMAVNLRSLANPE